MFGLVVYSGIHYDSLALSPLDDMAHGEPPTAFARDTDQTRMASILLQSEITAASRALVTQLRESHYYTDTANFELLCKVCRKVVKGETVRIQTPFLPPLSPQFAEMCYI
jgi:ubiquitin thioesterase OTU1